MELFNPEQIYSYGDLIGLKFLRHEIIDGKDHVVFKDLQDAERVVQLHLWESFAQPELILEESDLKEITIERYHGIKLIAKEVTILGKKAPLHIRFSHKRSGETIDFTTSAEIAREFAEWLKQREKSNIEIIDHTK